MGASVSKNGMDLNIKPPTCANSLLRNIVYLASENSDNHQTKMKSMYKRSIRFPIKNIMNKQDVSCCEVKDCESRRIFKNQMCFKHYHE